MSSSISHLTSRSTFLQVSPEVPVTKVRRAETYDPPEVFEGAYLVLSLWSYRKRVCSCSSANKRELVQDLIVKAKQVAYLINSLPEPEAEGAQVRVNPASFFRQARE
jgi:mediator of RNA polymerase II transcription subunit 21